MATKVPQSQIDITFSEPTYGDMIKSDPTEEIKQANIEEYRIYQNIKDAKGLPGQRTSDLDIGIYALDPDVGGIYTEEAHEKAFTMPQFTSNLADLDFDKLMLEKDVGKSKNILELEYEYGIAVLDRLREKYPDNEEYKQINLFTLSIERVN